MATKRLAARLLTIAILALAAPLLCRAAEESQLGALYVTTAPPDAAVYVNGELRGVSPCGIGDVPAGSVEVRAERQGFSTASSTVQITGGAVARVDFTLAPLSNVGSLAVLVEPQGADIEVDRVPAGRSPKVLINVVAGTHRVTINKSGYLPMHSTVTLAPGENNVLPGRLEPSAGAAAPPSAADVGSTAALPPDSIPSTAELPDERALEPVRKLVSDRQYDDALARLAQLPADSSPELTRRIGSERLVILRIREVVEAAYKRLGESAGQDYVLLLRGGIRCPCTLGAVAGDEVKVRVGENDQTVPLRKISAEQVVRLASFALDPAKPGNRAKFALLHAAEGDYDAAYEELRAAAEGGYDTSSDKSYVDAERLWTAAVVKEARTRALARSGSAADSLRAVLDAKPVPLLVDTYHGRGLPAELAKLVQANGFLIREHDGAFQPEEAGQPAVLLVYDPGAGGQVRAYDRQEVQSIVNLVKAGGGLVYLGAVRPMPSSPGNGRPVEDADPFAALLRWTGILVQAGSLTASKDAPAGFGQQYVPAYPAAPHPVNAGVRQVVFAAPVAPLATDRTALVLLRASPYLLGEASGEAAPPLAAASGLGKGRVLVCSAVPLAQQSPWERSPLSVNDGTKALLNGLAWVSEPARDALK